MSLIFFVALVIFLLHAKVRADAERRAAMLRHPASRTK